LEECVVERISKLLEKMGLPVEIKAINASKIVKALIMDKKVYDGKIKFVLPDRLGKVIIKNDVPLNIVTSVLKEMGAK
jgi:3-dehydroquinate synthase